MKIMCRLFIGAEPSLWEAQTRSLRLDGVSTSVRLERFYWEVLEEVARRDGHSLTQLIGRLSRECDEAGHDQGGFASFLRVCCGRYLALRLAGEIPAEGTIASLDAEAILARERRRRSEAPAS
ncbi:hypothetical protein Q671_16620 [Halomonas sp. PBN3]|nr:hypothetical protein Q671_16620 [Halomonas sp. PBN3]